MKGFKKLILLWWLLGLLMPSTGQAKFQNFITVQNGVLMDGQQEFRFFSFNIPNLLLIEDNLPFVQTNPWRLPNYFEIRDALLAIKQMGGKVARTYVITVKRNDDLPGTPKHVLGPGILNPKAFAVMDTVLALANELGVRLIIPLVDNWRWMGGREQYAAFRNKAPDDFWHDEKIKQDFKQTIEKILNRKNSVTGVYYKDDPAIMIWELGNELRGCPPQWMNEMAAFIKSIDQRHLLNDGLQGNVISEAALNSPWIDVLSTHHYEGNPLEMIAHIQENLQKIDGQKPYYLGEFGFIGTQAVHAVLQEFFSQSIASGALLWSLRFHNRDGGFYWHSEPFGSELYKAFHWPGFTSGQAYDEEGLFDLVQQINHTSWVEWPSPYLLPIHSVGHISWQGATGAACYFVERAISANGPWQQVSGLISDAAQAYTPLFNDQRAVIGDTYFYRIVAVFPDGQKTMSNVVGPVTVNRKWLVDNCDHYGQLYHFKGQLMIQKNKNRSFKEDLGRLAGKAGSEVWYRVPGNIRQVVVQAFQTKATPVNLAFEFSSNGQKFTAFQPQVHNFAIQQNDYDYQVPLQLRLTVPQSRSVAYVKIIFTGEAQLGRVEIEYQ